MTGIPRAFVAVVPPPAVLDAVEAHLRAASFAGWRESRRQQWHLTLEFLGRVDDADDEVERLATIGAGLAPFVVRLGGAGAFPDVRNASVAWLGVAEGARELGGFATLVRSLGADRFHPHLTVARTSRRRDATTLVATLDAPTVGPSWEVDAVELIASDTHPSGARSTTIARLSLSGAH